jgi:hypothetical protein
MPRRVRQPDRFNLCTLTPSYPLRHRSATRLRFAAPQRLSSDINAICLRKRFGKQEASKSVEPKTEI